MTAKQQALARQFLHELMYKDKVPDFHKRVGKDGDLRSMAATGAQAAVRHLVRNPEEVGEDKRYGITPEEAEFVVDEFVREMSVGKLAWGGFK